MRVIDGHNDALLRAWEDGGLKSLLDGDGAVTVAAARAGDLAAGLFAVFSPSPMDWEVGGGDGAWEVPPIPELPWARAAPAAAAIAALAFELVRAGGARLVRDVEDLDAALADGGPLGLILHMEGAEALGEDLEALELWYAAGLRSLGPVWSRPNRFGSGVRFKFPSSPDTGPGLTPAGRRLVRRCAELGIAVDLSHLTEGGFWDVAHELDGPLIASHSCAHALVPASRNLTDAQIRAIASSGGLVGINFEVSMVRPDSARDADTPLSRIAEHVRHVAELVGTEHVALGSDWDGATMPDGVRTAAQLPALIETLRRDGYSEAELARIAHGNWRRVLAAAWGLTPSRANRPAPG
ncbi:dipeptidase [Candidatus Solirubrobacter pratensis]|uniref:dipeptidase n=1 Tax=Candidatus Solirubrobacter pratensis TaxID=1298857 RepID=UPI00056D7A38|nr:dipeptidase [Candidatus Solirubrobacter pratensis]